MILIVLWLPYLPKLMDIKNLAQRVEDIITSLNVHRAPLNTPSKGPTAPVAYDDL